MSVEHISTTAELREMLAKATRLEKLPLYTDTEQSEGAYGSGPNARSGYDATLICADGEGPYTGQQRVLFDSHNSTVALIEEEYHEDGCDAFDVTAQRWGQLIVAAVNSLPSILDTIEALEVERDALLEALRTLVDQRDFHFHTIEAWDRARALTERIGQ